MSYQLLSKTSPVARKDYKCVWCPEYVRKGEQHVHEVSTFDGDLQDHRWHFECYGAALRHFKETSEEEFGPHEFKRGTSEMI